MNARGKLLWPVKGRIVTEYGKITVSVDGYPWIIYTDPEPLPVGTIAFENIEAVNAIDDIVVVAMQVSADARETETSTPTPTETPTTTPEENSLDKLYSAFPAYL